MSRNLKSTATCRGTADVHMVQQNPELDQTPFIFLSAKSEQGEVRKGMSLGADDYITKPFDPTDLLNAIDKRLKKSELVKKKISQGIEGINEMISFVGG